MTQRFGTVRGPANLQSTIYYLLATGHSRRWARLRLALMVGETPFAGRGALPDRCSNRDQNRARHLLECGFKCL